jgi:hypothetical protein
MASPRVGDFSSLQGWARLFIHLSRHPSDPLINQLPNVAESSIMIRNIDPLAKVSTSTTD